MVREGGLYACCTVVIFKPPAIRAANEVRQHALAPVWVEPRVFFGDSITGAALHRQTGRGLNGVSWWWGAQALTKTHQHKTTTFHKKTAVP